MRAMLLAVGRLMSLSFLMCVEFSSQPFVTSGFVDQSPTIKLARSKGIKIEADIWGWHYFVLAKVIILC